MELQEISDRLEITDLVTAYTRAVDTFELDRLRALFTEDAVLDYRSPGGPVGSLEEVLPFVRNLEGFARWQHVIGQVSIEFEDGSVPGRARATAYFVNPMVDHAGKLWEVGGYYHHELRRTPDGWRSARMVDEVVWSRFP